MEKSKPLTLFFKATIKELPMLCPRIAQSTKQTAGEAHTAGDFNLNQTKWSPQRAISQ
jgi:hypothetical protein